jgi:hypothetical protein
MLAYFKNRRIDKMWKEGLGRMVIMDQVEREIELTDEQKEYLENLKRCGENGEKLAALLSSKDDLFVGRVKHELIKLFGGLPADLLSPETQKALFPKEKCSWSKGIKSIIPKLNKKATGFNNTSGQPVVDFDMMTENNKNLDIKAKQVAELIHKDLKDKLSDEENNWLNAWGSEKPAYRNFLNKITNIWLQDRPEYRNIVNGVAEELLKMNWKKKKSS